MLNFTNLAIRRGSNQLFRGANFTIDRGNKVGITGANGCGKSSLFALLRNELTADEGGVTMPPNLSIAHVAQEIPATNQPAIEYVLDGDAELRDIERKLKRAEQANDGHALAKWHDRLELIDAYTAEARAAKIMQGLGFKTSELKKPVSQFSGGWRMRLNLAQALMCRSDLLLLDEPTNHLDLDAIIWLEQWLQKYPGTLLLISHDRDFLDRVTDRIMHIEHQAIRLYSGNYSDFERQRAEQLAQQQALYEKQQQQVAHLESFIRRFRAKATKAKQAQARIKALQRMELVAKAHVDSPFHFSFFQPDRLPAQLMSLDHVVAGYDEKIVLDEIHLSLFAGDRIGLLGRNGAGKSTLVKLLAGELPPLKGKIASARNLKVGYFAQHQLEQLDPEASPMAHLQRLDPELKEQDIRTYLGGFNFHGDQALEPVAIFSGGEKARLVLALLIYQKPGLLLLDEPTNHLDIDMRLALSLALQDYEGAVVLVSHDRHMLRSVTDRFLLVNSGRIATFDGSLEDYRQWFLRSSEEKLNNSPKNGESAPLSKKQQRQQQAQRRRSLQPLKSELKKIEERIEALQEQKRQFELELACPTIYEADQKDRLLGIFAAQSSLNKELAALEGQWLKLSEELEAMGQEV